MALGGYLKCARWTTNVCADVLAFCMSAFRPYILRYSIGVPSLAALLWSVSSLRLKNPTHLDLQTEEHMNQRRREKECGRHCVFG